MLRKLFKINEKNNVNIWVRKSVVKFKNKKQILIEVSSPGTHYFIFKDRIFYSQLEINPIGVIELLNDTSVKHTSVIEEEIKRDGFFYYNGKKINFLKEEIR